MEYTPVIIAYNVILLILIFLIIYIICRIVVESWRRALPIALKISGVFIPVTIVFQLVLYSYLKFR